LTNEPILAMRTIVYEYISNPTKLSEEKLTSMELKWAKQKIQEKKESERPVQREDNTKKQPPKSNN
jgi:hypothetical protein